MDQRVTEKFNKNDYGENTGAWRRGGDKEYKKVGGLEEGGGRGGGGGTGFTATC